MAPLRRYLRISPRSVLEVRIYLDDPRDLHRWLLHPATPALPAVVESVRPFVLPKLREENEVAKGRKGVKGKKRGGVKDVVVTDDFEVSIFLTQTSSRHSILRKSKFIKPDPTPSRVTRRRQTTLTQIGNRADDAFDVDNDVDDVNNTPILREEDDESDDEAAELSNIPFASKSNGAGDAIDVDDMEDVQEAGGDDKKKIPMNTSYQGFAIYGRILCLVVKRVKKVQEKGVGDGKAMMEEWIGTQVAREEGEG